MGDSHSRPDGGRRRTYTIGRLLKAPPRIAAQVVLRTGRGPLGPLWVGLHRVLLAALVRHLGRPAGTSVYLRGSFAEGEAVLGLSDIDLVVVAADREAAERRWARLRVVLHPLVNVKIYGADELAAVAASTILLQPAAVLTAPRHLSLRTRPGLAGATRNWHRLAGPEARPAETAAPHPCVTAWLELQCWWRYAVWAAAHRSSPQVPYLCFKLVAEGTRTWLWLARGELVEARTAALQRGLELMPGDERVLRGALDLYGSLHRSPSADLDGTLAWLVSLSERVGGLVQQRAGEAGPATSVRLVRDGSPPVGRLPLADWRALAVPEAGPREVVLADGDPRSAAVLAAADEADRRGAPWLLPAGGIFLIPSGDIETTPMTRGTLRIVQCPASDPVTTALLSRAGEASFPAIPGWRAADWAERAVAERRAAGSDPAATARAERFLASLQDGEPALEIG